jgi:hypothetical protein
MRRLHARAQPATAVSDHAGALPARRAPHRPRVRRMIVGKVRAIVEAVSTDWPGTLVVYEEYVPGAPQNPLDSSVPGGDARASPRDSGSDGSR